MNVPKYIENSSEVLDMVRNATHIACLVYTSGPGNYQVRDVDVPRPKPDIARKVTGIMTWPDVSKLRCRGENTVKLAAVTEPEKSPRVRETVTMPGDVPPHPIPTGPCSRFLEAVLQSGLTLCKPFASWSLGEFRRLISHRS